MSENNLNPTNEHTITEHQDSWAYLNHSNSDVHADFDAANQPALEPETSMTPNQCNELDKTLNDYNYWRLPGEKPQMYKVLGVLIFKELCPTTNRWVRKRTGLGKMPDGPTREARINTLIEATKLYEATHLCMGGHHGLLTVQGHNAE